MAKLIITRGLPGSGKTTAARRWVDEDPINRARVNRDDLRTMLHGGRLGTSEQESQVTVAQQEAAAAMLRAGWDVVCDDTNLWPAHVDALSSVGVDAGAEIEVWDYTDVPLDVCIARDAQREGAARVGEDVIRDMWERHLLPQPPNGVTVVIDKDDDAWFRVDGDMWESHGLDARTWKALMEFFGPLRSVVLASETFPVDLARRLVDAARDLIASVDAGNMPLPSIVYAARSAVDAAEAALPKAVA